MMRRHVAVNRVSRSFSTYFTGGHLSEDQVMLRETALSFSEKELTPFAAEWDRKKIFPEETLRKAASLGFGGLFVSADNNGTGLGRADGAVIFEALSTGVSTILPSWFLDTISFRFTVY